MSKSLSSQNILNVPELADEHRLRPVLRAALAQPRRPKLTTRGPALWDAQHFGLSRSPLFVHSSSAEKAEILKIASRQLLEEAYFIEKSGMSFAAKMSLLAESTQERMLFSLFAADESRHFDQISGCLQELPASTEGNPFLSFLEEIIHSGDRNSLILLIQVVLEGWGITHYRKLREGCSSPEVRAAFQSILKDEAKHHGSGVVLFKASHLSHSQRDFAIESLHRFLSMVQVGPLSLLAAIERVKGHLSRTQKSELLSDLKALEETQEKLRLLRSLLIQAGATNLVEKLDNFRSFEPSIQGMGA